MDLVAFMRRFPEADERFLEKLASGFRVLETDSNMPLDHGRRLLIFVQDAGGWIRQCPACGDIEGEKSPCGCESEYVEEES